MSKLAYNPTRFKVIDIIHLCSRFKYLQLRRADNSTIVVNSKVVTYALAASDLFLDDYTGYYSYRELSFHEYISLKNPIM